MIIRRKPSELLIQPSHCRLAACLGEAVLGHCPSAEKIDLTRFWNWQDAPADTAPGIGMVQLPTTTPPLTTGVTAPNSLTNLPPLINSLITAPQPNTSLLSSMGQNAANQQDFNPSFTGQQQLASIVTNAQNQANSARSDALKTSQTMAVQSMNTITDLAKAAMSAGGQAAGGGGTPAKGGGGTPAAPTSTPAAGQKAAPAANKSAPAANAGKAAPAANAAGSAQGAAGASGAAGATGATDAAAGAAGGDAAAAGGAAVAGDAGAASGAAGVLSEIAPLIALL